MQVFKVNKSSRACDNCNIVGKGCSANCKVGGGYKYGVKDCKKNWENVIFSADILSAYFFAQNFGFYIIYTKNVRRG